MASSRPISFERRVPRMRGSGPALTETWSLMGISLCMIAYNEEEFIERCLSSVTSTVDEIVVGIDDRTTDRTLAIAETFRAKIVTFHWSSDFSVSRNITLDWASHEWILVLDADESLTRAGHSAIYRAVTSAPEMDAFQLAMEHRTLDDSNVIARDWHTRLFKSHLRYQFPIHEDIQSNTLCQIQTTEPHVVHYGYDPLIYRERSKLLRNLEVLTDWVKREPYAAQPNYYLAKIMFDRQRNSAASTYAAIAMRSPDELSRDQADFLRTMMAEYAPQ